MESLKTNWELEALIVGTTCNFHLNDSDFPHLLDATRPFVLLKHVLNLNFYNYLQTELFFSCVCLNLELGIRL